MSFALGLLGLLVLSTLALISVTNTLSFPRLGKSRANPPSPWPSVSVIVPARNEAAHIATTLRLLLAQEYPAPFEIIVVDDQSEDHTAQEAERAADGDNRLRVVRGAPLPPGWVGKTWTCHQASLLAKGEWLVFTDADVHWGPHALRHLIHTAHGLRADMFSVWPTQDTVTWGERLVVPLMMFAILAYLPELCVRYIPWPVFAAANGQCLAFRKGAYQRLGGHQAVRTAIVEDVALARRSKALGLRLVMALGEDHLRARMYNAWSEVRQGFAKNILAGHGGRPLWLILSTFFHGWLFIYPYFWLVSGAFTSGMGGWPLYPLAMILFAWGIRALSAAVSRQRLADALAMPLSVALMTVIALQALWWHYRYGGPRWKGRQVLTHS